MSESTISISTDSPDLDGVWHLRSGHPVVLIRAVPGALHVTINGKCHRKPMTAERLVDLAEDCLRAAIDMRRGDE